MNTNNIRQNTRVRRRYVWIDAWRGVAVLGMIAVHIAMLLDIGQLTAIDAFNGVWFWVTQAVRYSFLLLVGVSSVILYTERYESQWNIQFVQSQSRRAQQVAVYAIGATVLSAIAYPAYVIHFGILHLITVAILLCMLVVHLPRIALLLGGIIYAIGFALASMTTNSWLWIIIGMKPDFVYNSFDLFALLPWLAWPLFGVALGHILYAGPAGGWINRIESIPGVWSNSVARGLSWIGQRALSIYGVHGTALLLAVYIARIWFL